MSSNNNSNLLGGVFMVNEPEIKRDKKKGIFSVEGPDKYAFGKEFDPKNPHKMFEKVREIDIDGQGKKKR